MVRALLKKIKRRVMVGDKVLVGSIDWVDRRGMIENVFQRENEILDPPVANVDHLLVLFSLEQPKLEPFMLTRFLVEAESTGIPLTLALNKMELVNGEVRILFGFVCLFGLRLCVRSYCRFVRLVVLFRIILMELVDRAEQLIIDYLVIDYF